MNHFLTNLVRRGAGRLPPSSPQPEVLPTFATPSDSIPLDSLQSQELSGEFFDPFDEIVSPSFPADRFPISSPSNVQPTSSQTPLTDHQTNHPSSIAAEATVRSAADNVSIQPQSSQPPILNQPASKPTEPTAVSSQTPDRTNQASSRLNSERSLQAESVPGDMSQSSPSQYAVQKAPTPPPLISPGNLEPSALPQILRSPPEVAGGSVTPAKNDSQLPPSRQNPDLGSFEQSTSPATPSTQSPLPSPDNPSLTPTDVKQLETSLQPAHQASSPLPEIPAVRHRTMPSDPPIQVHIGQVEVRMTQPPIAPQPAPAAPSKPKDFAEYTLARNYLDRVLY